MNYQINSFVKLRSATLENRIKVSFSRIRENLINEFESYQLLV